MNAADLAGLSLRDEAAIMGETIAQASLRRAREGVLRAGGLSGKVWRSMPINARQVLVSFCTDRRNPIMDAERGWQDFDDAERARIASTARELRRAFNLAGLLR